MRVYVDNENILRTEISLLTNLRTLTLDGWYTDLTIPTQLASLGALTDLSVSFDGQDTQSFSMANEFIDLMRHVPKLELRFYDDVVLSGAVGAPQLPLSATLTNLTIEGRFSGARPTQLIDAVLRHAPLQRLFLPGAWFDTFPAPLMLANLQAFGLDDGETSGVLPTQLALLRQLTSLGVDTLRLTLDQQMPALPNLRRLTLRVCSSSLPSPPIDELLRLYPSLEYLNEFGCLPERQALANVFRSVAATNVTHLRLYSNEFVGPFPSQVALLTRLTYLDLSLSEIGGGSLPNAFSQLTNLKELDLEHMKLNGTLPQMPPQLTDCHIQSDECIDAFADDDDDANRLSFCGDERCCEVISCIECPPCTLLSPTGECTWLCEPRSCSRMAAGWLGATCMHFDDVPAVCVDKRQNECSDTIVSAAKCAQAQRAPKVSCADPRCVVDTACQMFQSAESNSLVSQVCAVGQQAQCPEAHVCDETGDCVSTISETTTLTSAALEATTTTATTKETTSTITTNSKETTTMKETPTTMAMKETKTIVRKDCSQTFVGWLGERCLRFAMDVFEPNECDQSVVRALSVVECVDERCANRQMCVRGTTIAATVDHAAFCSAGKAGNCGVGTQCNGVGRCVAAARNVQPTTTSLPNESSERSAESSSDTAPTTDSFEPELQRAEEQPFLWPAGAWIVVLLGAFTIAALVATVIVVYLKRARAFHIEQKGTAVANIGGDIIQIS